MEPITLTATAIATLIFSKALEQGGEQLGKAVSDKIGQLLNLIRTKFQKEGVAGKLTKAQEEPSEKNKARFERELAEQMEDDEAFAKKLRTLMDELKLDEQVNQIIIEDSTIQDSAEIVGVEQTTTRGGSINQKIVSRVEVDKDLKIGNVKQQS